MRLRVDVTSGGWATLSTDPNTHIVDDEELPWIAVSPPIVARITTCGQPLLAKSLEGEDVPAYYFLNRTREVSAAFLLENQEIPYDTVFPRNDEVSPGARYREFFTQELDKGEFLCWPFMSYRKGAVVRQFSYRVEPSGDQLSTVPQDHLAVKRLADGTRLIRYGPDTANGPLWHRAMFGFETRIYSLTPSLQAE